MLTERERRQLATIEQDLERCDPALSALFTDLGGTRRRLLYARSLVGFGGLLMVTAVLLSLDAVFMQGLVAASVGGLWWAWVAIPSAEASGGDDRGRGTAPGRGAGRR